MNMKEMKKSNLLMNDTFVVISMVIFIAVAALAIQHSMQDDPIEKINEQEKDILETQMTLYDLNTSVVKIKKSKISYAWYILYSFFAISLVALGALVAIGWLIKWLIYNVFIRIKIFKLFGIIRLNNIKNLRL